MNTTQVGIDIAKAVFEVALSDRPGTVLERHRFSRERFRRFFAARDATDVLMEACGSAHYWGRELQAMGHRVVLLHPGDVVAVTQEFRRERVAEGVAGGRLRDPGATHGPTEGPLYGPRVEVPSAGPASSRVLRQPGRGEDELPGEAEACFGVLPVEGAREGRPSCSSLAVFRSRGAHALHLGLEGMAHSLGHDGVTVPAALSSLTVICASSKSRSLTRICRASLSLSPAP